MHIGWGAGAPIEGTPFRRVVPAEATEGRVVVLAVDMPVGENVEAHTHDREDQIIVVISGIVGATIGEEEVELTAGSVAFLPRNVPHSQWNKGDEKARVLDIYTPAGFELVFEKIGSITASGAQPTPADFGRIFEELGRT